jgi:hypothetical protein
VEENIEFRFITEGFGTTCSIDLQASDLPARVYTIYILLFGFIVPLFIIFFSYRRVCAVLFKSAIFRRQSKNHGAVAQSETDPLNQVGCVHLYRCSSLRFTDVLGTNTDRIILGYI